MRFGVVVFPGTWSDCDFHYVVSEVIKQPVKYVWHRDRNLAARIVGNADSEEEAVVRVQACGVCHTDLSILTGHLPSPRPIVPMRCSLQPTPDMSSA